MKKILFGLLACMLVLSSCSNDENQIDVGDENVAVTISASLNTAHALRALPINQGSQYSGIDNVDPELYKVRYILEVWDAATSTKVGTQLKNVKAIAEGKSTSFTLNLIRGKKYKFVVWADITTGEDDLNYNTTAGLDQIEMIGFKVNDESKDAFYVAQEATISTGTAISLTLKRPLGKIRFLATDYKKFTDAGGTLNKTKANYLSATKVYTTFNAVTGEVGTTALASATITPSATVPPPAIDNAEQVAMFFDYLFVPTADATNGLKVAFAGSYGFDATSTTRAYSYNNDKIVVKPNTLTTVKANIFTIDQLLQIIIDDSFDDFLYPVNERVSIGDNTYETIALAMIAATSGDVIKLLEGTYAEDVNVKTGVTLAGAGADKTVITGYLTAAADAILKDLKSDYNGKSIAGTSTRTALGVTGNNVTIDNVTFVTTSSASFTTTAGRAEAIVTNAGVTGFVLQNSTIEAPYWKGVYLNNAEGVEILNNTFVNLNPFSTDSYHSTLVVTGNTFSRNSILGNSQMIHLITVPTVEGNDYANWPTGLQTTVVQIKESNTWTGTPATGNYYKAVRVNNYYVGKEGNTPANWSFIKVS